METGNVVEELFSDQALTQAVEDLDEFGGWRPEDLLCPLRCREMTAILARE